MFANFKLSHILLVCPFVDVNRISSCSF